MSIGTKNRLAQTGTLCKTHLREHYPEQLALVEEFIIEIEGAGKSHDPTRWNQFTDAKRSTAELLQRVDAAFAKWLNP
jgi:hypothetical protein